MQKSVFVRMGVAAGLFAIYGVAAAQVTRGPIRGVPVRAGTAVRESVTSIMRRERSAPPRPVFYKYEEKEGPDRHDLLDNPASPLISSFPELDKNSLKGGEHGTPKFSVAGGFEAANFNDVLAWPPDTMGDVSPTQILLCVNGRIRVFDKNGNMGALNANTDTFFNSVKTTNWFTTDPRVRWDPQSQRWFVVMIDAPPSSGTDNRILIAVSNGATIDGSTVWSFYKFNQSVGGGDTTRFFDYPTLGIDKFALYIGGNSFGSSFGGCDAFVVRKSDLVAGTLTVTPFRNLCTASTGGPYTPQGVDNDDPNATEGYFVGVDNAAWGTLDVVRVSNPGGTPTLSASAALTVPDTKYAADAPNGTSNGRKVDTLDDRLFVAKVLVNRYTGTRTIWTAHNIGVSATGVASNGGRAGARWYQIQGFATGGTPSLVQSGTVFDSAATNPRSYFIPTAIMNGEGHALIGSSYSSATEGPGAAATFRFSSDALGTTRTPLAVQTGTAGYADQSGLTVQRWGDYSHTVVDPADGMTVWTFQEYAKSTTQFAVRVTKLLAPPPAAISGVTDIAAGSTQNIVVTGTSTNGSGFFDPGAGFVNRIAASISGTGLTINSITVNSATQVTLNVTATSGAAAGARTLTITNPDGQQATANVNVTARMVTGTVTLQDFVGDATTIPVTVEIRTAGTTTALETTTATLDASGNFSVQTSQPAGTYDVAFKASHWLRRTLKNVTFGSSGATSLAPSLINGDVNGDNQITATDNSILSTAYRSRPTSANWDARADLNGDNQVSATDASILSRNFRTKGDN